MLTGVNPARAGEDSYGKSEAIMIPPKGTGPDTNENGSFSFGNNNGDDLMNAIYAKSHLRCQSF